MVKNVNWSDWKIFFAFSVFFCAKKRVKTCFQKSYGTLHDFVAYFGNFYTWLTIPTVWYVNMQIFVCIKIRPIFVLNLYETLGFQRVQTCTRAFLLENTQIIYLWLKIPLRLTSSKNWLKPSSSYLSLGIHNQAQGSIFNKTKMLQ